MTQGDAAVLRAAASYGLRMGLYKHDPNVEDQILSALRKLNQDHDLPPTSHDGWAFERPIPPPPGGTPIQFIQGGYAS